MHETGTVINVYLRKRYRMSIYILIIASIILCSGVIGYLLGYNNGSNKVSVAETEISAYETSTIALANEEPIIPEVIEEVKIEQPVEEIKPQPKVTLPNNEIDLLALITMAEAEGESEIGKRLVIDTILNRVEHSRFPNTVHDVIYQPGQFEALWNGRSNRCYVKDDIRNLVIEEMQSRTNSDVIFFRTGRYSSYGTPLFKEGNHYFSSY